MCRLPWTRLVPAAIAAAIFLLAMRQAESQTTVPQMSLPNVNYFATMGEFYDGEYKAAFDDFNSASRTARKIGMTRWVDSICYYTMMGECCFQVGDFAKALENYNAAMTLYVTYSDWMIRVAFPPSIQPASTSQFKPVPWGASSRRAILGHYRDDYSIGQGQLDNSAAVRQGGVVDQARMIPINVVEIVRCTSLAMRRRGAILGPIAAHDTLTNEVLAAASRRSGQPNHWSEVWLDLQLGLALAAAGKDAQAFASLERAVLAAGQYDHPLTSTALLQLGIMTLGQGNYPAAAKYFEEATYAAANYTDPGVLEEAFRYSALVHWIANRKGIFPPLLPALAWTKTNRYRQLQASLFVLTAENCAAVSQTKDAERYLEEARRLVARRKGGAGAIGARIYHISGLTMYQNRRTADGDNAIASALKYMQGGSLRLFQIALADNLYSGGTFSPRVAMDLYKNVLRDPQPADWIGDPLESLATLVVPHPIPYEHWFDVAIERKEYESALEIADRLRRHRFFNSLALGGRVQALRNVLGAPADVLDRQSELGRQDLLNRYPAFEQLNKQAGQVLAKLRSKPLAAEGQDAFREQMQGLTQLAALSQQQEALVREIAVRREASDLAFPPLRTAAQIQKSLPDKHALLVFLSTSRNLHAFLFNNKQYAYWKVASPQQIHKRIVDYLREMGHYDGNREVSLDDVSGDRWKQPAQDLLTAILKGSQADFSKPFDELVIVPDGPLWYLPFESLLVSVDQQPVPLISRFRIRYVPTASLAVVDGRGRKRSAPTGVAVGQLGGRDSEPASRAALEQIAKVLPDAVALPSPLPVAGGVYSALIDRLVVLDDLANSDQPPYAWSPIPDRAKTGNTLGDWLALPWRGPEEVILPGFHTAAENALKKVNPATAGNEVFLSVCGLMASGARTALVSRWRTGGQTCFELVREFAQELPRSAPADAWQRSVFLCMESKVNLEAEPRLKRAATADNAMKAAHPFFWAGYLLVDSGGGAQRVEAAEAGPAGPVAVPVGPDAAKPVPPVVPPPPAGVNPPGKNATPGKAPTPPAPRNSSR